MNNWVEFSNFLDLSILMDYLNLILESRELPGRVVQLYASIAALSYHLGVEA